MDLVGSTSGYRDCVFSYCGFEAH